MSAAILSQDILAICLIAAGGDTDLRLEEIIRRVENFQEHENRHFGISRRDFRAAFLSLCYWELELIKPGSKLDGIRLIDLIQDLLTYHDAWFNDEGVSWSAVEALRTGLEEPSLSYDWYGCDEVVYQKKKSIKQQLLGFFGENQSPPPNPARVRDFLKITGITDEILFSCSRTGEAS